jgi:hypothetical protein
MIINRLNDKKFAYNNNWIHANNKLPPSHNPLLPVRNLHKVLFPYTFWSIPLTPRCAREQCKATMILDRLTSLVSAHQATFPHDILSHSVIYLWITSYKRTLPAELITDTELTHFQSKSREKKKKPTSIFNHTDEENRLNSAPCRVRRHVQFLSCRPEVVRVVQCAVTQTHQHFSRVQSPTRSRKKELPRNLNLRKKHKIFGTSQGFYSGKSSGLLYVPCGLVGWYRLFSGISHCPQ